MVTTFKLINTSITCYHCVCVCVGGVVCARTCACVCVGGAWCVHAHSLPPRLYSPPLLH